MAVRDDCRHYVMQTTVTAERVERCKLGVNEQVPFACPEGCLFYEPTVDIVGRLEGGRRAAANPLIGPACP